MRSSIESRTSPIVSLLVSDALSQAFRVRTGNARVAWIDQGQGRKWPSIQFRAQRLKRSLGPQREGIKATLLCTFIRNAYSRDVARPSSSALGMQYVLNKRIRRNAYLFGRLFESSASCKGCAMCSSEENRTYLLDKIIEAAQPPLYAPKPSSQCHHLHYRPVPSSPPVDQANIHR